MEADVHRFYPGIDYADRFRRDEYDRPLLTLRKLAVLIRYLPGDSSVGAIGRDGPHWSVESHMLDELRITSLLVAGVEPKHAQPHPQRPKAVRPPDPEREKKFSAARRRAAERKRKIAAGEIT